MSMKKCKNCINSSNNPSITFSQDGLCVVCARYKQQLNMNKLKEELKFVKSFSQMKGKYNAMVGISGGKDSTATLFTVKEMGFKSLAFTFDIGYTEKNIFSRSKEVAQKIGTDFKKINIKKYINNNDRKSFEMTADLYDEVENSQLKKKFKTIYIKNRKTYSTKDDIAYPFIRPCQICRKVVIKAYYAEALKRGVSIVFIGINEWVGLSNQTFSAIRKLQPFPNKNPVYIVHLPFLLQRSSEDIKPILKKIGWKKPINDLFIETGAGACYFARACEDKSKKMLGFHIDSTRLSREITAGFINKEQAKKAIKNYKKTTKSVRQVLQEAEIIN